MMKNERFEGAYRKFRKLIIRYVEKKTSDHQFAEEISHRVFCEFFIHMGHIDPAAEKVWLMRCTKRAVIDYLRRKQHCMESLSADIFSDSEYDGAEFFIAWEGLVSLESRFAQRELIVHIFRDLEQVNTRWYEVAILCFVLERSYAEAAEYLKVPVDVVRGRIRRARVYIRANFYDEFLSVIE
ncbi:MAG: sigma-70 family RNA polymerase sigma factor [Lachnospiraceae bacterium]|nr:sigma-70 family RNA polymerase sigma factor [Lachnospiraceae bacterium]